MTKSTSTHIDEIAGQCLAVRTRITSRDITRLYDDHLRPLGLRITQLSVLVAIGALESAQASQVGEALHLDKSTLSRTLSILRQNRWIEDCGADDGRARPVRLSAEGRKLIRRAHPLWRDAQAEAKRLLDDRPNS